jgi:hypothetical protein
MTDELTFDIRLFQRLVDDPLARREMLFLRAKEKGDDWSQRDLKRVDPEVEARIRAAHGDFDDETDFGRLQDECYERHARRIQELDALESAASALLHSSSSYPGGS